MAGFRLEGLTPGRIGEVDTSSALRAVLPTVLPQAGYVALVTVNHDGSTGTSKLIRSPEISVNRRLRVGMDSLIFQDTFINNAQNSTLWNVAANGATMGWANNGFATLNSGNATGTTNVTLSTWRYFPFYTGSGNAIEFEINVPQATDATTTVEFGMFQATGGTAPTDGIFFRGTAGTLLGVINFNGSETTISLGAVPTVNTSNTYEIKIEQELAEFWINNNLVGILNGPAAQAELALATYQPITIRTIGTSTTVASLKIGMVRLHAKDMATSRSWAQIASGMGLHGSQHSTGTTAFYTGDMAVTTGTVLSNTTVTSKGIGGQVDIYPALAINNDGILFAYQVPPATTTTYARSLIVTGIRLQSVVTSAISTTATLVYSFAYGSTGFSLAGTEAAGGASTTKAFRRIPLGVESYTINAPPGTMASTQTGVIMYGGNSGAAPIVVNPGEWMAVAVKNVANAATGTITVITTIDSHWE